ncbi:MAG: cyclic nucleotide-binding domain-containing protein [Desulfobacteraceae bacterium]|jgi:CRP-like cAMP-binding protein
MVIENFLYAYVSQEEEYDKGETIIREGSQGDWVYLILEGEVKVKKMTARGLVTVDTLSEGEIFGEMVLWQLGKVARTASVIAETKVKVALLDTELLLKEYESVSPRLKSLFESLIHRLAATTQRAVKLATG